VSVFRDEFAEYSASTLIYGLVSDPITGITTVPQPRQWVAVQSCMKLGSPAWSWLQSAKAQIETAAIAVDANRLTIMDQFWAALKRRSADITPEELTAFHTMTRDPSTESMQTYGLRVYSYWNAIKDHITEDKAITLFLMTSGAPDHMRSRVIQLPETQQKLLGIIAMVDAVTGMARYLCFLG